MPEFVTEIRKSPTKDYVKVFLKDKSRIKEVQILIKGLQSVHNVNITENKQLDLTVYPAKVYSANETVEELNVALEAFFNSNPIDPIIKEDLLDSISEKAYNQILDKIYYFGKNLEKFSSLHSKFDEEGFREFFLPYLNAISDSYTATGETFNKIGKTDILIQNPKGENVFIAECKVWGGEGEVIKAVDQLLTRYVTWRDEKLALIIFNKTVNGFTDIISKAIDAIKSHPNCKAYLGSVKDSTGSFLFYNPDDPEKVIKLELIMFNCK